MWKEQSKSRLTTFTVKTEIIDNAGDMMNHNEEATKGLLTQQAGIKAYSFG